MHNVVWITLLLFAFDRVIQHPAAGQCSTANFDSSTIAVEQFWPNAAKIRILAVANDAAPSWSIVVVLDNALPASVKVLSMYPGLLVNISSERRHITVSPKCPDSVFNIAGAQDTISIFVGLLPTGYQAHWCRARAGFIASQTEDASCVGIGILASSSGPPTFGCYDRPPECPTVGQDVVFLIDSSQTVGGANFDLFVDFAIGVTRAFNIEDQIFRFGVVQFSEWDSFETPENQPQVITVVQIGLYTNRTTLETAIGAATYFANPTLTSTSSAIQKAINTDLQNTGRLTDIATKKTIVLLTESAISDPEEKANAINLLASSTTKLIAVGVRMPSVTELQEFTRDSSGPYTVSTFAQLPTLKQSVVDDLIAGTLTSSGCT